MFLQRTMCYCIGRSLSVYDRVTTLESGWRATNTYISPYHYDLRRDYDSSRERIKRNYLLHSRFSERLIDSRCEPRKHIEIIITFVESDISCD